jgi:hypothetical protein
MRDGTGTGQAISCRETTMHGVPRQDLPARGHYRTQLQDDAARTGVALGTRLEGDGPGVARAGESKHRGSTLGDAGGNRPRGIDQHR